MNTATATATGSQLTAVAVVRGYQWGISVIAAALITLTFILGGTTATVPAWVNVAALCGLYLITVRATMHLLRRTPWGIDSYLLAALALTIAALAAFALPGPQLVTAQHWTLGAVGWPLVVCLLDRGLAVTGAALAANLAIVLAALAHAGRWDAGSLTALAITSIGILTPQLAATAFATPLRATAAASEHDADTRTLLLAADAVATRLQEDNQQRYDALRYTVVPLLRRLAQGTADPGDRDVRWRARVEATRMRRLFAEAEPTDDPLLHAVRATIEEVERAGVAISLDCPTPAPPMPTPLRRALLEHPMATLSCAITTARVVITTTGTSVSLSVVTDGPPPPAPPTDNDLVQIDTTVTEDQTWTQASCRLASPR